MLTLNTDKTIPYRLSPAELASLRVLRNKINPSNPNQDDKEEDEMPRETNSKKSVLNSANQKAAKNIP